MTVVVAVWSVKGGVLKTTLTLNLAVEATRAGSGRVLAIDADPPQHSLCLARARRGSDVPRIVSAGTFADLEAKVALARERAYAVVLIDTPPGPGPIGPAAAGLADFVLIPTRPTPWDLAATSATLIRVRQLDCPHGIVIAGAAPRRDQRDGPEVAMTRDLLRPEGGRLWGGQITQRAAWWRAATQGQGVSDYEPGGPAAAEAEALWTATWRKIVR